MDEFSAVSEPKRPVLESSISLQAPNTSSMSKGTCSASDGVPAATSQASLGSVADLFRGRSQAQVEPRSRKRKEMEAEAEMQMDEIMSLMSEDMECFDEQPSGSQEKKAQPLVQSSAEQKRSSDTAEASSSSKRQRVDNEALGSHQKPKVSLEKGSGSSKDQRQTSKQPIISIKIEPSDYTTAVPGSRKPSERSRVSTSNNMQPFEDVGFIKVRCKHFISSYSHHVKKMNCLTLTF